MTNPNDAIGTNAAYGGRTSTNAFNDVMATLSRGVLSGWACVPNTGMTVSLGGDGNNRDVAIAQDNAGNKTSINNISQSPVDVTMSAAPASNTRIDAIVAYVDNPATGNSSEADNPDACGLIAVNGTPSASPVAPNESAIRTAITADGASGTTAYYVILAYITIPSGTTDITNTNIQSGASSTVSNIAPISTTQIQNDAVTQDKIDLSTLKFGNFSLNEVDTGFTWVDGKHIYKKTINFGALPNTTTKNVNHGISNLDHYINYEALAWTSTNTALSLPAFNVHSVIYGVSIYLDATSIIIEAGDNKTAYSNCYVTIYYTKTS